MHSKPEISLSDSAFFQSAVTWHRSDLESLNSAGTFDESLLVQTDSPLLKLIGGDLQVLDSRVKRLKKKRKSSGSVDETQRAGGPEPTYPAIDVLGAADVLAGEGVAAVRHSGNKLRRTEQRVRRAAQEEERRDVKVKFVSTSSSSWLRPRPHWARGAQTVPDPFPDPSL